MIAEQTKKKLENPSTKTRTKLPAGTYSTIFSPGITHGFLTYSVKSMLIALEARLLVKDTVPQGAVTTAWMSKHTTREEFLLSCPIFEKYIHCPFLQWSPDITHTQKQAVSMLFKMQIIIQKNHSLSPLDLVNANFLTFFPAERNVPLWTTYYCILVTCIQLLFVKAETGIPVARGLGWRRPLETTLSQTLRRFFLNRQSKCFTS